VSEPKDIRTSQHVVHLPDGSVVGVDGSPAGDLVFKKVEFVDAEQFSVEIKWPVKEDAP